MAGTYDADPARKLAWNERAISAADAETDRASVAWFYPSLYNNLAYSLMLVGRRDDALSALRTAWSYVGELEPGPYMGQVRSVIRRRLDELEGGATD